MNLMVHVVRSSKRQKGRDQKTISLDPRCDAIGSFSCGPSLVRGVGAWEGEDKHVLFLACDGVRSGCKGFTVDEGKRTCSCRMWQLSGIPCFHATKVIFLINRVLESDVPAWFETDMYLVAYHNFVKPVLEDVDVVQRGPVRDEGAGGSRGDARGSRGGASGSRGGASRSRGRGVAGGSRGGACDKRDLA
ncbi:multidrug resistance-associated protein 5 [Tanacetum coccineum]|uniref:Multidrug resistance-associated protein 5 n=1 Tax=Tanacetum coccineum TaxID=301880 RepID=A0ABQ5EPE2_9ASTR